MTVREQIRRLQPLVPASDEGVTILAYHLVGAGTASSVDIPARVFAAQMRELADVADVVSLEEAIGWLLGPVEPESAAGQARPRVVLTFDDGYANFVDEAFPILRDFGFPAVLYVPIDFVDGDADGPLTGCEDLPPCSWRQLGELADSGLVTIGSHTCSHVELTSLSDAAAVHELVESKRVLEGRLGVSVDSFCYPRAQWNDRTEWHVQSHYRNAVVAGGSKAYPNDWRPHRLPRVPIRSDTPDSLIPILRQRFWLEEWVADRWRRRAS